MTWHTGGHEYTITTDQLAAEILRNVRGRRTDGPVRHK
jgi:hypothetical protein